MDKKNFSQKFEKSDYIWLEGLIWLPVFSAKSTPLLSRVRPFNRVNYEDYWVTVI